MFTMKPFIYDQTETFDYNHEANSTKYKHVHKMLAACMTLSRDSHLINFSFGRLVLPPVVSSLLMDSSVSNVSSQFLGQK